MNYYDNYFIQVIILIITFWKDGHDKSRRCDRRVLAVEDSGEAFCRLHDLFRLLEPLIDAFRHLAHIGVRGIRRRRGHFDERLTELLALLEIVGKRSKDGL